MNFKELSTYLEKLETTSSRLSITSILAELFGKLTSDEIREVCYLLTGGVAPSYEGIVFNIADKMMLRALAKAYSVELSDVLLAHKKLGDIGQVAFELANKQRAINNKQGVSEVYEVS